MYRNGKFKLAIFATSTYLVLLLYENVVSIPKQKIIWNFLQKYILHTWENIFNWINFFFTIVNCETLETILAFLRSYGNEVLTLAFCFSSNWRFLSDLCRVYNFFPIIINGFPLNFICCSHSPDFPSSNNIFRPFKSSPKVSQNK